MSETLIFENALLIDGTGGEPQEGRRVVVADGTIREVSPSSGARPVGRVIDLRGQVLLPGLIDAHVHVGNLEIRNHLTAQLPPTVYVLRVCKNLKTDLDLGFTTVRDAAGTYVMAHAYASKAIQHCVQAGVRSIEHGNLMDEATARLMAERGAFFVPTLITYDLLGKFGKSWGLDDYSLEKLALVGQAGHRALEFAHRAGVKIASGSDIVGPMQGRKGGELAIKAEVLGPMGAIVAQTKTNAELLNVADRLGTVEPGKLADLIVLDGDPLKDLGLFADGLTHVRMVVKEGRVMKDTLGR